jgi:hypothetical protein
MKGVLVDAVQPGARAVVAIRPENLGLYGGAAGSDVVLQARVVIAQYLGSLIRYELEAGEGVALRADVNDPKQHTYFAPGHEVTVGFKASSAQVFPEGSLS